MNPETKDLEGWIREYLDGELPEGERGAFLHRLRNDPEATGLLAEHAMMDARLRKWLAEASPVAVAVEPAGTDRPGLRRRWLAAAALVALLIVAAALVSRPAGSTFEAGDVGLARFEVSPFSSFSIEGPGSESGRLEVGGSLILSQGAADLRLASGVRCVATAPTRITLIGRNELSVDGGLAHFEVPEGAEGFKVRTTDFEVIDHGTEFTIDSTQRGRNEAHVLRGRIEVRDLGGKGGTSTLTDGQAVRSGEDGLNPMAADPGRFLSRLPNGLPALWFSFDGEDPDRLPVAGSLAETASVGILPPMEGFTPPKIVGGRFGQALRFPDNRHSLRTSWPGIEGTMARSISLWFRSEPAAETRVYMPLVAWGLPAGPQRMSLYSIELGGKSGQLRLRIASGRRWLQGNTVLDDGEWHHLVVVLEAHRPGEWPVFKILIDGRSESVVEALPEDFDAAPLESFYTVVDDPRCVPLTFGRFSEWQDYPSQPWEIDEVVIAAGILLPQQIDALGGGRPRESGLALGE